MLLVRRHLMWLQIELRSIMQSQIIGVQLCVKYREWKLSGNQLLLLLHTVRTSQLQKAVECVCSIRAFNSGWQRSLSFTHGSSESRVSKRAVTVRPLILVWKFFAIVCGGVWWMMKLNFILLAQVVLKNTANCCHCLRLHQNNVR